MKCWAALCLLLLVAGGALRIPNVHRQRLGFVHIPTRSITNLCGSFEAADEKKHISIKTTTSPAMGVAKFVLPLALPMLLVTVFGVNPAVAATAGAMAAGKGSKKATPQELRSILDNRFGSGGKMSILQKIFLGVNAKGKLSNWQAGDTRTEISMLINGLSMCAILGGWAAGAYVVQKREEAAELRNMRREVVREKEYRENMYFDAVQDIQKRLADPNLKSGKKANLLKQLSELDPDGRIRDFMAGKADRPDLSSAVDNKRKKSGEKPAAKKPAVDSRFTSQRGAENKNNDSNRAQSDTDDDIDTEESVPDQLNNRNRNGRSSGQAASGGGAALEMDIFRIEPDNENSDAGRIREMLLELREKLVAEKAMTRSDVDKLFGVLRRNFAAVYKDAGKRERSIKILGQKLDDTQYWVDMVNNMQG